MFVMLFFLNIPNGSFQLKVLDIATVICSCLPSTFSSLDELIPPSVVLMGGLQIEGRAPFDVLSIIASLWY